MRTHLEGDQCRGARWRGLALVSAILGLLLTGAMGAAAQDETATLPAGTMMERAQSGRMGSGTMIEVPSSNVPYVPTPAQIAAHEQLLALKSRHLAPPIGPHTTAADVVRSGGPQTEAGLQQGAPTSFTVFKKQLINSICPNCAESTVNEPSAANSGKTVIETSNWNIAYTNNGGASPISWLNQNPYNLSSGYCCDTQVVYNEDRDIFILLLLDYAGEGASTNGLTISITRGLSPTSWCTYKFRGSNFGEGSTDTLDFAKIGVANNNLYLTWNDYPPNSGFVASGLARFPLDSLAACAGFSFNYLTRNTEFTFALAQQASAHDVFYWVSNWFLDGTTDGSNLRIFHWAENSTSYFWNTVGISPFNFIVASCGSPNWCSRLDPRSESVVITPAEYRAQANAAFGGDQILEVAGTAGPSGFSSGQNYVLYNYFKLNSLTYLGTDETYNTSFSFAYPGCAVNDKGYVGCSMAQGSGGVPGGIVVLQDNVSPTQPWNFNFIVNGISGASAWGDYDITNPWQPGGGPFQTVLWNVNGSTVQPYYIVWGRGSDRNDYSRWKSR